ncbi:MULTISPECIES: FecR domain-containing protein [unclassified Pseudomonas]|uniref:FecR domain-containing protein n=1 Tax=unclassified Pseudomonas TaxID=196821 RepID=UPI0015A46E7D|nr:MULTISPECIES: FecR domain-containing protein [unclassified Pseudomonas]NWC93798.1 FecR domain-containing protein [Pseudomonas sp. IPO3779]NWD16228.1 FecR domain-containing protein [Pseudomonas sp. IPO3778]
MALDHATLEAAARWYVDLRCDELDDTTREAHRRWLDGDPRHRQAWERLTRLQERFERVGPGIARPTLSSARAKRREVLKVLSLLVAAGGTGALAWRTTPLPSLMADQRTATGEHRRLRLDDGSQLQLNTATAVNISYSPHLREVQLLSGEILIDTARDTQARPFVVHTREGSIRALGTRFIVRSAADRTHVCVLEHAVEVRTAHLSPTVRVEAGQQLAFSEDAAGNVQPASQQADAWTHGMLVVNDWRLGDFISELQRYRPGHLACDPTVAAMRISGAFQLANTDTILENLTSTLPVRVRQFSRYWTRVEPA